MIQKAFSLAVAVIAGNFQDITKMSQFHIIKSEIWGALSADACASIQEKNWLSCLTRSLGCLYGFQEFIQ